MESDHKPDPGSFCNKSTLWYPYWAKEGGHTTETPSHTGTPTKTGSCTISPRESHRDRNGRKDSAITSTCARAESSLIWIYLSVTNNITTDKNTRASNNLSGVNPRRFVCTIIYIIISNDRRNHKIKKRQSVFFINRNNHPHHT